MGIIKKFDEFINESAEWGNKKHLWRGTVGNRKDCDLSEWGNKKHLWRGTVGNRKDCDLSEFPKINKETLNKMINGKLNLPAFICYDGNKDCAESIHQLEIYADNNNINWVNVPLGQTEGFNTKFDLELPENDEITIVNLMIDDRERIDDSIANYFVKNLLNDNCKVIVIYGVELSKELDEEIFGTNSRFFSFFSL